MIKTCQSSSREAQFLLHLTILPTSEVAGGAWSSGGLWCFSEMMDRDSPFLSRMGMINPGVKESLQIRHWIWGFQLMFHFPTEKIGPQCQTPSWSVAEEVNTWVGAFLVSETRPCHRKSWTLSLRYINVNIKLYLNILVNIVSWFSGS